MTDPSRGIVDIERTRAQTGLLAVVTGDVAIGTAAIIALYEVASNSTSSSAIVSILTSACTAIGTLTTAYFGIKAVSNTAQSYGPQRSETVEAGAAQGVRSGERAERSQSANSEQPPDPLLPLT